MGRQSVTKAWVTPSALALVIAVVVSYATFRTSYEVMASQVNTNTETLVQLTKGLVALANDKKRELEGRLAVLRFIAGENGGLTHQQQLEYDRIMTRLKALK